MTSPTSGTAERKFVPATLPWVAGAGGLLVYLLTLNHWLSLQSLPVVARISGWLWRPELRKPLTALVLAPFRLLPEPWIPLALNLFTALCAAAVLVLLARSVTLLPHDVNAGMVSRRKLKAFLLATPTAWMPPVLAVVLCGLQLSFWEHATVASGEMLDLLVLAYVIRCVLEYRIDENDSWLARSALVYGAGMANNWELVAYFPVFVLGLAWAKKPRSFLVPRFLLRTALWGVAGLSFYLLLPLAHTLFVHDVPGFWAALKQNLSAQKAALTCLRYPAVRTLVVTSLLPLLLVAIRWRSHTLQSSDDSRLGVFLAKATAHFVHGLVFLSALWLALDPGISPRHLELGAPMLGYYYISALAFGYCAGYFLLLGSARRRPGPAKAIARAGIRALVLALPLALLARNLGEVTMTNGSALRQFARQLYADLPDGKAVVLSEQPAPLLLLRAEASARRRTPDLLLLDMPSLVTPDYQRFVSRRYGARWPVLPPTNQAAIGPARLLELVARLASREPVFYLHPSSCFLFEAFTAQPRGSVQQVVPRSGKGFADQACDAQSAAANEQLWQERWSNALQQLAGGNRPGAPLGPEWARPLLRWLGLEREQNATRLFVGAAGSKALNDWGVALQRREQWAKAGVWFGRALELNPGNLAARLNLEYNSRYQRGQKERFIVKEIREQFSEHFAKHKGVREIIDAGGPIDEPTFLFQTGWVLSAREHYHQAAAAFARSARLAADWPVPRLWLAEACVRLREYAAALEQTEPLEPQVSAQAPAALTQLFHCRVAALRGLGRTNEATACIEAFLKQHPQQAEVLTAAAELYQQGQQFASELAVLEQLLQRDPKQPKLLTRKGFAELQLGQYEAAIASFTAALALSPEAENARLCRAIACLGAEQLEVARQDYEKLLQATNYWRNAVFGLGTIAWHQQATNEAIKYYSLYLSNNPPVATQRTLAADRLRQLQGAPHR